MVGEEAEAGVTVEGGEEAGGGVIAGAGEASLPGEIILANSCRVPNAWNEYVEYVVFFLPLVHSDFSGEGETINARPLMTETNFAAWRVTGGFIQL